MTREIGAYEAKTHLGQLLDAVEEGETVYITRRGTRVAELRPVAPGQPRERFGFLAGPGWHVADDFDAPLDAFGEYR